MRRMHISVPNLRSHSNPMQLLSAIHQHSLSPRQHLHCHLSGWVLRGLAGWQLSRVRVSLQNVPIQIKLSLLHCHWRYQILLFPKRLSHFVSHWLLSWRIQLYPLLPWLHQMHTEQLRALCLREIRAFSWMRGFVSWKLLHIAGRDNLHLNDGCVNFSSQFSSKKIHPNSVYNSSYFLWDFCDCEQNAQIRNLCARMSRWFRRLLWVGFVADNSHFVMSQPRNQQYFFGPAYFRFYSELYFKPRQYLCLQEKNGTWSRTLVMGSSQPDS